MSAPLHRVLEGLRQIKTRISPQQLVRAKAVVREQEARFLLEMVADAVTILEDIDRRGVNAFIEDEYQ
jgi:hypothetical protein